MVESCETPLERLVVHLILELGWRRNEVIRAKFQDLKGGSYIIREHKRGVERIREVWKHPLTDILVQQWLDMRGYVARKAIGKITNSA